MPISTDNTALPKKRIKEKQTVNIGTGSHYIDLYIQQDRRSAFNGVVMDSDDTIYVNGNGTHLAEESALTDEFGSVPASYIEVSILEPETTDTYVEDIDHYEAWN
ncbi:hypothetical protein LCGC14_3081750 [marine sediment metagenome]|uniref:Uncharacterized protein n=1 Tax=marine sediment metagenome TaxID=412755 RepID=A0A0F8WD13_9ZZZZ